MAVRLTTFDIKYDVVVIEKRGERGKTRGDGVRARCERIEQYSSVGQAEHRGGEVRIGARQVWHVFKRGQCQVSGR